MEEALGLLLSQESPFYSRLSEGHLLTEDLAMVGSKGQLRGKCPKSHEGCFY